METHKIVMLPIALGEADNFLTFLVYFFIVDPMLSYEAILTWGETRLRLRHHHRADYQLLCRCRSLPPQCPIGFHSFVGTRPQMAGREVVHVPGG
jgi:hypothetical protein